MKTPTIMRDFKHLADKDKATHKSQDRFDRIMDYILIVLACTIAPAVVVWWFLGMTS